MDIKCNAKQERAGKDGDVSLLGCALLHRFMGLSRVLSGKGETAIGKPLGRSEPVVFKEQTRVSVEWRRGVGKSYVPWHLGGFGNLSSTLVG